VFLPFFGEDADGDELQDQGKEKHGQAFKNEVTHIGAFQGNASYDL
jgi:hypothetical protein